MRISYDSKIVAVTTQDKRLEFFWTDSGEEIEIEIDFQFNIENQTTENPYSKSEIEIKHRIRKS